MSAQEHPSYAEELERCRYTLSYAEKALASITSKKEKLDREVERLKKHFNSDSSQDYIDLVVNSTIQSSMDLKIRNLLTAISKPYFARVDFSETDTGSVESMYIGKMCLMREENQELVIVDWRAPVANLYYEGRLDPAHYDCPEGRIEGELLLKRQFSIDMGKLKEIFDIDITTNDRFLQTYLGANAHNRLKEIVSTIQVEQNLIVRAGMWKPLIVQGAAGSGKTTIALHRIAYLIYNYDQSFKPENFMIIAPNKLFLNYISEVLPELGVEKVRQTTFEEFALELVGKKLKIRDGNEKLVLFASKSATPEEAARKDLIRRCSEFKTSMLFKEIMDDYVEAIAHALIPRQDFKIGSRVVFRQEEICRLFLDEYKMWPVMQRLNELKKSLANRLKAQKESMISELHESCDLKVRKVKALVDDEGKKQEMIARLIDRKNEILDKLEAYCKKAVNDYIKGIPRISPFEYYRKFVAGGKIYCKLLEGRVEPELAEFTRTYSTGMLDSGHVEIEDLAPVIYLKYRLYGMDEKIPVRHVVIDEAQDFSAFQIFVLKKIVKDSSFTILGDLCQGIHSYRGTRDWNDITGFVFDDRRSEFLTLEQSYRTTMEIMEAANKVVGELAALKPYKSKPVIRHGECPAFIKAEDIREEARDIAGKITVYREEGLKSAAVICKTLDECKVLHFHLKKNLSDISVVTGKEEVYKGGTVIVPSYLAKGLEFDAVFIVDADSRNYTQDELDAKLLYVAMTRALHRLCIYYTGEPSPLLEEMI